MQPSRRFCLLASALVVVCATLAPQTLAEALTITSTPPGATVEIDGLVVGTTPYRVNYPGGYFHRTVTLFGQRLRHSMTARVYKDGYVPHDVSLTEGPFEWTALNGRDHGTYYLLRMKQIEVKLDSTAGVFDGTVRVASTKRIVDLRPELPVEEVVERASQAVVKLRNGDGWGTGFFVTNTGVIATNAHVARGNATVMIHFAGGSEILGKVVYVDSKFDLALVKAEGKGFPYLPLADGSTIRIGETVIAIGNPGLGMENTVTRGIVSAVNPDRDLGSGTWIQTDAAINPGNSGGPLLNLHGEVLGINTLRAFYAPGAPPTPVQGIAWALSSKDLIEVLRKFYPQSDGAAEERPEAGVGTVAVAAEPSGAEIWIDGKFVGQAPSTIPLSAGLHHVEVKAAGEQTWSRDLDVLKDSQVTLHPTF
jgi:serine protease Do